MPPTNLLPAQSIHQVTGVVDQPIDAYELATSTGHAAAFLMVSLEQTLAPSIELLLL